MNRALDDLLNVSSYYQQNRQGAIIVGAVYLRSGPTNETPPETTHEIAIPRLVPLAGLALLGVWAALPGCRRQPEAAVLPPGKKPIVIGVSLLNLSTSSS